MNAFLAEFLWYLIAFAVGVLVMWIVVSVVIKPRTAEQAIQKALRDRKEVLR